VLGGAGAQAIGLRATFVAAGLAFPIAYFALAGLLRRRGSPAPERPADVPSTLV
jgi:hypothetical protein